VTSAPVDAAKGESSDGNVDRPGKGGKPNPQNNGHGKGKPSGDKTDDPEGSARDIVAKIKDAIQEKKDEIKSIRDESKKDGGNPADKDTKDKIEDIKDAIKDKIKDKVAQLRGKKNKGGKGSGGDSSDNGGDDNIPPPPPAVNPPPPAKEDVPPPVAEPQAGGDLFQYQEPLPFRK
jgi:uncharacterized protein YjbJ (UPF0337 family)